ncbi:unnamed protein product [Euphydryas editha]|uniref:G-protein coupled receptors family 2 profile 2 domain-containing protein n=1 Tax=Euphydryas editha TaxID=104508 RepID=A0AAU9U922_EUPED|nr:unnamed protein product [Euphydryas editha]
MTRKIELFLLFAILINNVTGDPEEPFCCKPGQGVLEDVSNVCVDVEHNVTSKTKLSCKKVDLLPISFLNFTVMDDGSLLMFIDGMEPPPVDKENFCVANETTNSTETVLVLCADEEVKIIDDNVLAYCMLVSVVFLSLTVFVYCILPEMRDVQGKSLINFCISLAIGLCILSFMRILEFSDMGLCAARGFFVYFFLLTSFFWTNAISIQILINIRRSSVADYGWNTFIWYALYAWGVPAVLTVCMAIVNFHPGRHPKPGIGLNTCWFYSKKQQWQYMYSVMTILILANICIFVHISLQVCKQSFSSNHIKALRYKVKMLFKPEKKLTDVYGEGVLTVRQCQNCFAKFLSGNFDVEDAPRSGRPVEANKDAIKALVDVNRRITTREIGLRLNLSNLSKVIGTLSRAYVYFTILKTFCVNK